MIEELEAAMKWADDCTMAVEDFNDFYEDKNAMILAAEVRRQAREIETLSKDRYLEQIRAEKAESEVERLRTLWDGGPQVGKVLIERLDKAETALSDLDRVYKETVAEVVELRRKNENRSLRAKNARLMEAIIKFHKDECGCLDWRRDAQCMTLYKILALAPASIVEKDREGGK